MPLETIHRSVRVAVAVLAGLLTAAVASAAIYENRIPTPNSLADVIVFASDDVWAVGSEGTVLHFDGTVWDQDWEAMGLITGGHDWQAVWGTSSTDLWIASYRGTVAHLDGSSWSTVTSVSLVGGMWGAAADDIWIVGSNGRTDHWDGSAWTTVTTPVTDFLYDVWGSASDDVWAVGYGGTIIHWDGTVWTQVVSGTGNGLWAVWGTGPSDVWAVGYWGTVLHWDGSSWADAAPAGATASFFAVGGLADGTVVAAGSSNQGIWEWDGSSWTETPLPRRLSVFAFARDGGASGALWGVGRTGLVLVGDGTGWSEVSSGEDEGMKDVFMFSRTGGFAVGTGGTILRRQGWSWVEMTSGVTEDLSDVWASGPLRAYAVGLGGTLLEWDGSSWSTVDLGTTESLLGVFGWPSGDVMIVGSGPVVYRWDGTAWTAMPAPAVTGTPTAIWGATPDAVWVTTYAGEVAAWDGSSWAVATVSPYALRCVWGRSGTDVWVGGSGGSCFHWDGTAWSDMSATNLDGIRGLWYSEEHDLLVAVTEAGELSTWSSSGGWSSAPADLLEGAFYDVHGNGSFAWIAGSDGALFRWGPWAVSVLGCETSESLPCRFLIRTTDIAVAAVSGISYETQPGTATESVDYEPASGNTSFDIGARLYPSWFAVDVNVLDDLIDEPDETLRLVISGGVPAILLDVAAQGVIVDDDPPAEVRLADATVDESAGQARVTMTIDPPSGKTITVHVVTADGTATEGADYGGKDQDISVPPGTASWDLLFPIVGDGIPEADETFTVTATAVENVTVVDGEATVTILDDDDPCGAPGDADGDCRREADDLALVVRLLDDGTVPAPGDPDCDGNSATSAADLACTVATIFAR